MKKMFAWFWRLPRNSLQGLIWIYQKTLSPDHSFWAKTFFPYGYCKFEPSCSQYMVQALEKYGLVKGLLKGLKRVFKCNPWTEGGEDQP